MYSNFFKRILDFILSLVGFVILLPVFILLYVILLFVNKGNPLFFQRRPGKNEKVFSIMKFKSMTDERDANGELLPNDMRLTKFGTFIRKTSLDEIPQLINVIKGDMSLIGPRPLRVHYIAYYSERERTRHSVRPGITGLAQVSGRNALNWDDKLELDAKYVENLSFVNDVKILFLTFVKLFNSSNTVTNAELRALDYYRVKQG
ncbi:sugar transferase [Flagellimonas iocasae]|uniref:Sugar transferase n=1 Tax=Flagellimonas iocasae TaxID=2055905 RepID=A0ABW4XXK9_9FLAO